ncbi:MAG: hypothetical protein M1269_13360 [Chloroflexi bacterium]|nr:hypothetical protein [Chloroflexota bacterium]
MVEIRNLTGAEIRPQIEKPEVAKKGEEECPCPAPKDVFQKTAAAVKGSLAAGLRGSVEGFVSGVMGEPKNNVSKVGKGIVPLVNVMTGVALGMMVGGPVGAGLIVLGLAGLPGSYTASIIHGGKAAHEGLIAGWKNGEYDAAKDVKVMKEEVKNYFDLQPDPQRIQRKHDHIMRETYNYFDLNK